MPTTRHTPRAHPNIAISGVPGTGKTSLCQRLRFRFPHLRILDMGAEAAARGCREEYDDLLQTWVVDEDKLVQALTPELAQGGYLIDWIHADMWSGLGIDEDGAGPGVGAAPIVDLVVTLHADNTVLFDRLSERKYSEVKISQNLDAEIMNEIGVENEEAFGSGHRDAFVNRGVSGRGGGVGETEGGQARAGTTLVQLRSDTEEDAEASVAAVAKWMNKWAVEGAGGSLAVAWGPSMTVDSKGAGVGVGVGEKGFGASIGVAR